ncbi:MAG: hypothetical protein V1806_16765 [Pseudomonadota bacterium]
MKHRLAAILCLICMAVVLSACAEGTEPMNTRAVEERYLGMGEAQRLYRSGQHMLREGRYRESLAAFYSAEQKAYTDDLRQAARTRRLWLQEVVLAYEEGRTPPPPPVMTVDEPPFGQEPLKPVVPEEASPPAGRPLVDPDGRPLLPPLRPQP